MQEPDRTHIGLGKNSHFSVITFLLFDVYSPMSFPFSIQFDASILHLDGKGCHETEKYSSLIVDLMNYLWDESGDENDLVPSPFEMVPIVKPKVSFQRGNFECGDILIRFAIKIVMYRGMKYNNQQFATHFYQDITKNRAFAYDQREMVTQRNNLKVAFMMFSGWYDNWKKSRLEMKAAPRVLVSEQPVSGKKEKEERLGQEEPKTSSQVPTSCPRDTLAPCASKPTTEIATVNNAQSKQNAAELKKQKRYNRWYALQAHKIGVIGPTQTLRVQFFSGQFFSGTRKSVEWSTAVQKSFPGMVELYRQTGCKIPIKIPGIIAMDEITRQHFVIPDAHVRRRGAKFQVKGDWYWDICTGPMKLHGPQSVPLVLVRWKNEYSFVTDSQIQFPTSVRKRKEPDRLLANEDGKLTWEGQTDAKSVVARCGTCPDVTRKTYMKYFTNEGKLSSPSPEINRLVKKGEFGSAIAMARNGGRPVTDRDASHDSNSVNGGNDLLALTLTFECLSQRRFSLIQSDAVVGVMRNNEMHCTCAT